MKIKLKKACCAASPFRFFVFLFFLFLFFALTYLFAFNTHTRYLPLVVALLPLILTLALAILPLGAALMRMMCMLAVVALRGQAVHQLVEPVAVGLTCIVPHIVQTHLDVPHGLVLLVHTVDLPLLGVELLLVQLVQAVDALVQPVPGILGSAPHLGAVGAGHRPIVDGPGTHGLDGLVVLQAHAPEQQLAGHRVLHTLLWCLAGILGVGQVIVLVGACRETPLVLLHPLILVLQVLLILLIIEVTGVNIKAKLTGRGLGNRGHFGRKGRKDLWKAGKESCGSQRCLKDGVAPKIPSLPSQGFNFFRFSGRKSKSFCQSLQSQCDEKRTV
jgi:hypothetical protein